VTAGPAQNAGGLVTLPNIITFGRLCAVPLAVWLVLRQDMQGALILFVLAGLSDAVDGWLARHRGADSAIGTALDPVVDKALLVSM
jgi:cardiolipin synthase (CMP-forming)